MNKNYYEILGVNRNTKQIDIKNAYHELLRTWHPDKHKGLSAKKIAQQKIAEINNAYENINVPKKRLDYNKELDKINHVDKYDSEMTESSESSESTESIDSDSSSTNTNKFNKLKQKMRELNISLEKAGLSDRYDTDFESDLDDDFNNSYDCDGNSTKDQMKRQRDQYLKDTRTKGENMHIYLDITLEEIYTGCVKRLPIERKITKFNSEKTYLNITIKQNAEERGSLSVNERGHYLNSDDFVATDAGNITIDVRMQKHELYTRKGFDLYTTMLVTLNDTINGFKRELIDLDGKKFTFKVAPFNKTDYIHIIKDKGLKKGNNTAGVIFINFIVALDNNIDDAKNNTKKSNKK